MLVRCLHCHESIELPGDGDLAQGHLLVVRRQFQPGGRRHAQLERADNEEVGTL